MIPNTDLVTTQVIPGAERRVKYTLSEQAVFSDGTPVTCSDYLLAFTAGMNPEVFGSHMPLFDDASELNCTPGSKEFTVIFKEAEVPAGVVCLKRGPCCQRTPWRNVWE